MATASDEDAPKSVPELEKLVEAKSSRIREVVEELRRTQLAANAYAKQLRQHGITPRLDSEGV